MSSKRKVQIPKAFSDEKWCVIQYELDGIKEVKNLADVTPYEDQLQCGTSLSVSEKCFSTYADGVDYIAVVVFIHVVKEKVATQKVKKVTASCESEKSAAAKRKNAALTASANNTIKRMMHKHVGLLKANTTSHTTPLTSPLTNTTSSPLTLTPLCPSPPQNSNSGPLDGTEVSAPPNKNTEQQQNNLVDTTGNMSHPQIQHPRRTTENIPAQLKPDARPANNPYVQPFESAQDIQCPSSGVDGVAVQPNNYMVRNLLPLSPQLSNVPSVATGTCSTIGHSPVKNGMYSNIPSSTHQPASNSFGNWAPLPQSTLDIQPLSKQTPSSSTRPVDTFRGYSYTQDMQSSDFQYQASGLMCSPHPDFSIRSTTAVPVQQPSQPFAYSSFNFLQDGCTNCSDLSNQVQSLLVENNMLKEDLSHMKKKYEEALEGLSAKDSSKSSEELPSMYSPGRGVKIRKADYSIKPTADTPPPGFSRLGGSTSEVIVPDSWLAHMKAKTKKTTPRCTVKRYIDAFFSPWDLQGVNSSVVKSYVGEKRAIFDALELFASQSCGLSSAEFNQIVNSKAGTAKRTMHVSFPEKAIAKKLKPQKKNDSSTDQNEC